MFRNIFENSREKKKRRKIGHKNETSIFFFLKKKKENNTNTERKQMDYFFKKKLPQLDFPNLSFGAPDASKTFDFEFSNSSDRKSAEQVICYNFYVLNSKLTCNF